ncbi:MAG: DNA mismatch repair protein MutS, partial [Pseudomonadota bacterium]
MSKSDSTFSKSQLDLLKQFKKQITPPHSSKVAVQLESKNAQVTAPEELDDADLFKTALGGVTKLDNGNIAKIERSDLRKKPDAKTLAKRAAAEGAFEINDAELSDTQAILNPVASQAALSYRIAT